MSRPTEPTVQVSDDLPGRPGCDASGANAGAADPVATKLLPCPFCASADIDPDGWASDDSAGPACNGCGASADSIERWNTRPTPNVAPDPNACPACHQPMTGQERTALCTWCEREWRRNGTPIPHAIIRAEA